MIDKILCIVGLMLFSHYVNAQQLTPNTINAAGQSHSAGGLLLEDAMGGLVVNPVSNTIFMYTPDFLQPEAGTTTTPPPIGNVRLFGVAGVDNGGTTFINNGLMLEFTVGEVASITYTQGANMLTQGILQPFNTGGVLPVLGLELYAKRISNTQVQLDWKTIQEINNKGFYIERRKENENSFANVGFVNSAALNGNSSFPLQYQKLDNNNFGGKTYYRVKQEDIDGRSTWSVIRIVTGTDGKQTVMQVWPVPSTGPVNVLVSGISHADNLMVFDMSGKLIQRQVIQANTSVSVTGLAKGAYIIRLGNQPDIVQRIVIQ
jgi:type IX secretion system substrate protein